MAEEDIVGGVGVDDQVSDFDGPSILPFVEGGIELNVALGTYPLTREPYHMVVVGHHLSSGYLHGLERFPVEDVYRTSLVHEGLSDGESVYIDRYYHRVVLLAVIHALKVLVRKGDGWHPRPECHRVYVVHRPQVLLPGVVGAPSPSEAADYGVDNLPITSSVGLPGRVVSSGRIVPYRLSFVSVISVISTTLW